MKVAVIVSHLDMFESETTSSDSSDNDEDACISLFERKKLNPGKSHRQTGYVEQIIPAFRLDKFRTFFRVSRVTVQCLKEHIVDVCLTENIHAILCRRSSGGRVQKPLEDRLLMMLWFMASLDKYASIAYRFGVSECTACCAIRNLLQFIEENLLQKIIVWPTEDNLIEIADMYENLKAIIELALQP